MEPTATSASAHVGQQVEQLRAFAQELRLLRQMGALLAWDEQTKMPHKGQQSRARQRALLAGMFHERATSDELLRRIESAENAAPESAETQKMRRDFDLATRIPTDLVREMTQASSEAMHAWEQARGRDDFEMFAPHLERLLELARREADCLGFETEPWDALHDQFEESMTAAELEPLFEQLREPIKELVAQQPEPDTSVLARTFPLERQEAYLEQIVAALGYDLSAGRIDPTTHPFCITIGDGDVRLTTRYDEQWLPAGLFSVIHEAGHGIYDQAFHRLELPATLSAAPGLGMHESQSRMYENAIGRSRQFWSHHYPHLQQTFPEALGNVDLDEFHRAINVAAPSLIRVEADELTYNLHIGVRFELERQIVNGDLPVRDLPEAWADAMERWVGVRPSNNADGVLQDVHWSLGSFGYFPTYTLGNVYAAQFMQVARRDIPDLDDQIARGDLSQLRGWFDEHVYQYGRTYTGREFVERITGAPIDAKPLIEYLREKFAR